MKPNIVYILADDLGYGDLKCLDDRCAWQTPHCDQLAADGMIFDDAHSSSAVCTPSRYSILTGRYAWRTWLKKSVLHAGEAGLMKENEPTVARMLQGQGYRTACVGKWHLGWQWAGHDGKERELYHPDRLARYGPDLAWIDPEQPIVGGPIDHGFDEFFGIAGSLDMPPYAYIEQDRAIAPVNTWGTKSEFVRPGQRQKELRAHDVMRVLTNKACDFIDRQSVGSPYFLYVPFTAPHGPIAPAPEFLGSSGVSKYGDFCVELDHRIGQVLAAIDASGQRENTLVIVTSDNGASAIQAECAQHEEFYGHFSSSQYRGYKSDIWDGGHRVPCIVRWPATIAAASRCSDPIGIFDLYATAADVVHYTLSPEEAVDACSFLPAMQGRPQPTRPLIHHSFDGRFAIRDGKWKLCQCPGSGGWSLPDHKAEDLPPIQLYDLDQDISEQTNQHEYYPEIVMSLTKQLDDIVQSGSSRLGASGINDALNPVHPNSSATEWHQITWHCDVPRQFQYR